MPNSVLHQFLDKVQHYGLEISLYSLWFLNKRPIFTVTTVQNIGETGDISTTVNSQQPKHTKTLLCYKTCTQTGFICFQTNLTIAVAYGWERMILLLAAGSCSKRRTNKPSPRAGSLASPCRCGAGIPGTPFLTVILLFFMFQGFYPLFQAFKFTMLLNLFVKPLWPSSQSNCISPQVYYPPIMKNFRAFINSKLIEELISDRNAIFRELPLFLVIWLSFLCLYSKSFRLF